MKRGLYMKRRYWLSLILSLTLVFGAAFSASAAVKVHVQPSGGDIPSAYAVINEARTYFGMAIVSDESVAYECRWEFSGGTASSWTSVDSSSLWYIDVAHTFTSTGLNWAKLTVRETGNPSVSDAATIEVHVLGTDTANRKKNSAIDNGLRALYHMQTISALGSSWGWGAIGQTAMALIAFENHGHNMDTFLDGNPDNDIYSIVVRNGLRWLFNHAWEVSLSTQLCIGDPEGTPGDPLHDDGDTEHDGFGVTFQLNDEASYSEGYEPPLAMLAIVNSCQVGTAKILTAESASSPSYVNGMSFWDIMVDAKDFLAFSQSDPSPATTGWSGECSLPAPDGIVTEAYFHAETGNVAVTTSYYFISHIYSEAGSFACDGSVRFKFVYGDGITEEFGASYCTPNYAEVSLSHDYTTCITELAKAYYTIDDGENWKPICQLQPVVDCNPVPPECPATGLGWRYYRNSPDSDNSVTQWPTLALEEARGKWGININPAVIKNLKDWLAYSQDGSGGFGYDSPGYWANFPKTGAGLAMLKYVGFSAADNNVKNALNYLDSGWEEGCNYWGGNLGSFYGMYAFYKGMKFLGLNTLNGRPWEDIYTDYLIANQLPDGSWMGCPGDWPAYEWIPAPDMTTSVALAMLAPSVADLPPVADAGGPYGPVNAGQVVSFDGSGSSHQDSSKILVKYEWDFDASDGLWWDSNPAPAPGEGDVGLTASKSYSDTGKGETYTVTLRVTDNSVPAKTDTDTALVNVVSGNVAPVALTNGPWSGLPGNDIVFDGSASHDPNACPTSDGGSCLGDSITKYEWDLDGDGVYDGSGDGEAVPPGGNRSIVKRSYSDPISLEIKLRVTDEHDLTGTTSPQVNIVSIALVFAKQYDVCWQESLSRFVYRQGIVVKFKNQGNGTAENVKMTLTQVPTHMTILSGVSILGNMAPGAEVTTQCNAASKAADIKLQVDKRINPTGEWRWKADFDLNGVHYTIPNLPAI